MQIAQDKKQDLLKEVQERAEIYFNSLEGAFQYTITKIKPLPLLRILVGAPIFLFFIFSLFPLIPGALVKRIPPIYGSSFKLKEIEIPLDSFVLWWISCALVGLAASTIYETIDKRLAHKQTSRELSANLLPFCYLYKAVKEIRAYGVNKRQPHLAIAISYLGHYVDSSESRVPPAILKKYIRGSGSEIQKLSVRCYDLINLLRDNYFWFKTDQTANLISSGLENFNPKIIERVSQGVETDHALAVLELLTAYEYSCINKGIETKLKNDDISLEEFGRLCLADFGRDMERLATIKKPDVGKARKTIMEVLASVASQGNILLKNSNILICFMSWYVFLSIVFVPTSIVVITRVAGMQMDSTIIIGIVTAPLAAAIAVATAIYGKSTK